jgi:hypothetical protein
MITRAAPNTSGFLFSAAAKCRWVETGIQVEKGSRYAFYAYCSNPALQLRLIKLPGEASRSSR